MRCCRRPARGAPRRNDGIADILAVALADFADHLAFRGKHGPRIVPVRPRLLAADEELGSAIERRNGEITGGLLRGRQAVFGAQLAPHPGLRLQIFVAALSPALTAEAGFALSAEAARRIEEVGRIDPDDTGRKLCGNMQGKTDRFAPDARGKAVAAMICKLDRLLRRTEGHRYGHRPEDFLGRDDGSRLDAGQQRRPKEAAALREFDLRLMHRCAFGDALRHQLFDSLQLHRRDDRRHIDRLVERMTDAERLHAPLQPVMKDRRHALLHQKA